jgi:hypothetical protein
MVLFQGDEGGGAPVKKEVCVFTAQATAVKISHLRDVSTETLLQRHMHGLL